MHRLLWLNLLNSTGIVAYQPFISSLNSENDFGAESKHDNMCKKNSQDKNQKILFYMF